MGSWVYLLAKYGTVGHVWYLPPATTVTIPADAPAGGLSHWDLFTAREVEVPDGGMTLMLLGGALVGLESLRRRFRV